MIFHAALAQINPVLGDVQANIKTHFEYINQAMEHGAKLIVFPELSLTGYTLRDLTPAVALRKDAILLEPFRKKSEEITIICGGIEEDDRYGLYNSAFVFDRGAVHTHRKVYPPDYSIFEERRYVLNGKRATCIHTSAGALGILVCEDLWHLSMPLLLALEGAECIVTIASSPTRMAAGEELTNFTINSENHRAYARLLSTYMLFVNRTGFEDGVNFWGGSELISPFGNVVSSAPLIEEAMIFTEIDQDIVRRARQQARHFMDEQPEILRAELKRILKEHERETTP